MTPNDKALMYLHSELQVQLEITEGFRVTNINVEFFESLWIWVLTRKAKKSQPTNTFASRFSSVKVMNIAVGNNSMTMQKETPGEIWTEGLSFTNLVWLTN